tara:strand:- start:633 stop:1139 length:507 start_codon:yes stop_codon:yes gene_type:complete
MGDLAGAENHPLAQQYPCRLPVWWGRHGEVEKDPMKSGVSGRLVVLRIPKQFRRFEGVLARLLKAPKEIRRPLDRMNSMLWELCDGSRTFVEICSVLDEVFKEEIAPVLHRTTAAIHLLQQNNLLLMLEEPLNNRWLVGPGITPGHQTLDNLPEGLEIDTRSLENECP